MRLFQRLTFDWLSQLLKLGSTRPLQFDDFTEAYLQENTKDIAAMYQEQWQLQLEHRKSRGTSPSLWRVIRQCTSCRSIVAIVSYLILFTSCRIMLPVLLNLLLNELSPDPTTSPHRNGSNCAGNGSRHTGNESEYTGNGNDYTGNKSYYTESGIYHAGNGSIITTGCRFAAGSGTKLWLYLYLGGLISVALFQPFVKAQYYYATIAMTTYTNSGLTSLVFSKVLCTQRFLLDRITSGHILNLVSKDLMPFQYLYIYSPYLIMAPVEILIVSLLLWKLVGFGSLSGMVYLVLLVFYQLKMGKVLEKISHQTAVFTDRRLRLLNDVISGIRVVKMNTLEWVLGNMIGRARRKEIQKILLTSTIQATFLALQPSFAVIATFISMVTLMLSGHVITPAKAFTTLTFMSVVRKSALEYLAYSVKDMADAKVTIRRIENFLLTEVVQQNLCLTSDCNNITDRKNEKMDEKCSCPEMDTQVGFKMGKMKKYRDGRESEREMLVGEDGELQANLSGETEINEKGSDKSLALHGVTCVLENKSNMRSYGKASKKLLDGIDFKLGPGSLTALIGRAGSGKSTVFRAILGEIPVTRGSIDRHGSVGYVGQTSWLFSGSVRENILFGLPLNQKHYDQVIYACALVEDFKILPHGDASFIGERGLSLSGGQRARVSLARAIYHDFDIYLLDDPLSAVDAKVGRHIFDECVVGMLSGRVRLLVTHHFHFLRNVGEIIVLQNGKIHERGSYEEVTSTNWFSFIEEEIKPETERRPTAPEQRTDEEVCVTSGQAEEDRNTGHVSSKTYLKYFSSYGNVCVCLFLVGLCLIPEATSVGSILWLSWWSDLAAAEQPLTTNLLPYIALSLSTLLTSFLRAYSVYYLGVRAAERLHNDMAEGILKSPVRFFDVNPTGRVLNRFSRDVFSIGEELLSQLMEFVQWFLSLLYSCTIVSIVNPYLFAASVPLMLAFGALTRYFLRAAREVKRLEAISCSPLLAHFSETFDGADIIRAFTKQQQHMETMYRYRDVANQLWLIYLGCKQWLAIRVELMCALFLMVVSITCVLSSNDHALTGLSITYALEIALAAWSVVIQIANVENCMTSVERVIAYTNLPREPGYETKDRCPKNWPSTGKLSYNDVSLTYDENGSLALNNVSFKVNAGEKVGIVGRTGAGKSSILAALFRMPEVYSGKITIDDVIVNNINIRDSRNAVACIPQSPIFFTESVRFNLDPFGERSDANLWITLEDVHMKAAILRFPEGLCYKVSEGGTNFSVGERQLLCMARALLQGKKIIVLDEATAHIDFKTDRVIQKTIREKFREQTVLTIAHRIDTILDYDKVVVLERGGVVEIGAPRDLLGDDGSIFSNMYRAYTSGRGH